jgi:hypothetical protein
LKGAPTFGRLDIWVSFISAIFICNIIIIIIIGSFQLIIMMFEEYILLIIENQMIAQLDEDLKLGLKRHLRKTGINLFHL